MKRQSVLIPNRGTIALDIIQSMRSMGLETILLFSPEDAGSLPVKLADRSYKFFASRPEDSYMDLESIMEMAVDLKVDFLHPGYGFLSESPELADQCARNGIGFIGPSAKVLQRCRDKIEMKNTARGMGIDTMAHSDIITSPLDIEFVSPEMKFPVIIKPVTGSGGHQIRLAEFRRDAQDKLQQMLKRDSIQQDGVFLEEFLPFAHHIEIPFLRDADGNLLILPEIESSIQRRFQKVFQESPSMNISDDLRQSMMHNTRRLVEELDYVGLGYVEFLVEKAEAFFLEINPTIQVNTLIPEVHMLSNFIKKQFVLSRGEKLHDVDGVRIIEPRHNLILVSLNAENPHDAFRPSAGKVSDFSHYATIRNVFKTSLFAGAEVSSIYDPNIGKILAFAVQRENAINDLRQFLNTILVRGIHTNLIFLKKLLESPELQRGETIIDFLNLRFEFNKRPRSDQEVELAAALLGAAFHVENRRKNYKAQLERMKQPNLLRRILFGR
ncbi:MAG: biotin carboxylase N-terminal domain-containing protein [Acidobacteriota bacterium]|jgi:acetyl-CoA carboxylase biotin carboxylase subunit|nr:biotin carboxylase N-terminal domain-containing protein [Acidobacteriota bacterium]